jgi:hypothetical protein
MMVMSAHSRGCDFLGKQINMEEISSSHGRTRQGETSTADEPFMDSVVMVNLCFLLSFDETDPPLFQFIPAYLHQFLDVHYMNNTH